MFNIPRKQIIVTLLLLSFSVSSWAQRDVVNQPNHDDLPYYLGMSIGVSNSFMNFKKSDRSFNPQDSTAATEIYPSSNFYYVLGLSGTLKLTNHLLARATPNLLIIGQKNIFTFKANLPPALPADTLSMNIPSTILHLPVNIKYQSDRYNFLGLPDLMRHYVFGGTMINFDLSANKSPNIRNISSKYRDPGGNFSNPIKGVDWGLEAGLGFSFYLRYATISPEIKFSYGLRDIKYTDNNNKILDNIDKLTSNFVYFTIHIEN